MIQETQTVAPLRRSRSEDAAPMVRLAALLALVGAKRLSVPDLRARMRLTPEGIEELLSLLQREYLVDVVSSLSGEEIDETVQLTERGERVLLGLLERTCELPELS